MEQNVPAWGSYLYQNFLLPSFSPGAAASWLASPFTGTGGGGGGANGDKQGSNLGDDKRAMLESERDGDDGSLNMGGAVKIEASPNLNDYFGSSWQSITAPNEKADVSQYNSAFMGAFGNGHGTGIDTSSNQSRVMLQQQQGQPVPVPSSQSTGFGYGQYAGLPPPQGQQQPSFQPSIFNPNRFHLPPQYSQHQYHQQQQQSGPSSFYPQPFYPNSYSISTSLLANPSQTDNHINNTTTTETDDTPSRPPIQPLTVDPSSFNNSNNNSVHRVSAILRPSRSRDRGEKERDGSSSSSHPPHPGSAHISPTSLEAIDDLVPAIPISASPSPLVSHRSTPHHSPKKQGKRLKRRQDSLDSDHDHELDHDHDHDHDHEHEHEHSDLDHEVPEGVERDGMIWGMKVEDYRALSARERKRVRNRISARTFRAKRKGRLCFTIIMRNCFL